MKHTKDDAKSALIIKLLVRRFRILDGWRIRTRKDSELKATAFIAHKRRRARIFLWHGKPPKDFELHEVLHCAFAALLRMDRRKPKELHAAEEKLVQDICGLFFPDVAKRARVTSAA